jgi:hypothetical protein
MLTCDPAARATAAKSLHHFWFTETPLPQA